MALFPSPACGGRCPKGGWGCPRREKPLIRRCAPPSLARGRRDIGRNRDVIRRQARAGGGLVPWFPANRKSLGSRLRGDDGGCGGASRRRAGLAWFQTIACGEFFAIRGIPMSQAAPPRQLTFRAVLLGADGLVKVGGARLGAVAAIMIGAVVCCAAAVGGDNLQDLKTGYLVGATPWKQQLMLGIGAFSCALIMAPVLNLLQDAYGIGSKTLPAPQANLMASVAKGLFGGELPWTMIAIGGVVGALTIALDGWLKSRGARFRVPVLAAAIGIYLPLELMVPIFLGGLLAHLVERFHKVRPDDEAGLDRVHRPGVLFSAGLITGEALMGIAIALPIVITQNPEVLALPFGFGAAAQWIGLAVLALVGCLLYRTGRKGEQAA
ncbi:MAG: oligopeptide transporter, OPT family [Pseudomonas sp.]